jgi:hypothetical protein
VMLHHKQSRHVFIFTFITVVDSQCKRGNLGPLYLLGDTPKKMCGSPSLSWLEVSPIEGITPLNL